jgi:hypothetical protein
MTNTANPPGTASYILPHCHLALPATLASALGVRAATHAAHADAPDLL